MTDKNKNYVRWFADTSLQEVNLVGGKGASLGELKSADIPIPDGFVVTTTAFRSFLGELDKQHGVIQKIKSLDPEDIRTVEEVTAEIRSMVLAQKIPDDITKQIIDALAVLSPESTPLAIRSSATSEDSDEASFAGLQDTYLWIKDQQQVLEYILQCWSSLYTPESVSYRLKLDLPEEQLAMGVVVQRMVDSRCAGVMFTRSPTTGDKSVVTIEASWGLGSSIVSGEVTPDKFVVSKITSEISSRSIATKQIEHIPLEEGGTLEREVDSARREIACISDGEIMQLLDTARKVEQHYGKPQDIEWSIDQQGLLFLLQSRPETVWSSKENAPLAKPADKAFDHIFAVMGGKSNP